MEHLAIMKKGYIKLIVSGVKKIETRFSQKNIAPYMKLKENDVVYMREVGHKVTASFVVGKVIYYNGFNEKVIKEINEKYAHLFQMSAGEWKLPDKAKYGTIIFIKNPHYIENPFLICKRNRNGFCSYNSIDEIKVEHF